MDVEQKEQAPPPEATAEQNGPASDEQQPASAPDPVDAPAQTAAEHAEVKEALDGTDTTSLPVQDGAESTEAEAPPKAVEDAAPAAPALPTQQESSQPLPASAAPEELASVVPAAEAPVEIKRNGEDKQTQEEPSAVSADAPSTGAEDMAVKTEDDPSQAAATSQNDPPSDAAAPIAETPEIADPIDNPPQEPIKAEIVPEASASESHPSQQDGASVPPAAETTSADPAVSTTEKPKDGTAAADTQMADAKPSTDTATDVVPSAPSEISSAAAVEAAPAVTASASGEVDMDITPSAPESASHSAAPREEEPKVAPVESAHLPAKSPVPTTNPASLEAIPTVPATAQAAAAAVAAPITQPAPAPASRPAPRGKSVEIVNNQTATGSKPNAAQPGRPRAAEDAAARVQRENEDMRLMWLSLPSHDHPSYYSDTDEDASSSSSIADALEPRTATGRMMYVGGRRPVDSSFASFNRSNWPLLEDEGQQGYSDEEERDVKARQRILKQEETKYCQGNRGNKLRKGARWIRVGKLGSASEAKSEKDIQERFTDRLKALQRSQVNVMLQNAGGPSMSKAKVADMLDGSDRLLLRDVNQSLPVEESSTLLAPQLLRPILSTRALLQSHTLRHTFRNPHIGALSRTALDLRESEGQLSRALSRCLGAMERIPVIRPSVNGDVDGGSRNGTTNGNAAPSQAIARSDRTDANAIGVEGTHAILEQLNPAFGQLDRLFVTKEGLPIPFAGVGEDGRPIDEAHENGHTILTAEQQRDVIRAALECLHELGADSLEYVERLGEVRSRLAAVKRKRLEVWNALRIWALKREGDDIDAGGAAEAGEAEGSVKNGSGQGADAVSNAKTGGTGTSSGRKRQRVAA